VLCCCAHAYLNASRAVFFINTPILVHTRAGVNRGPIITIGKNFIPIVPGEPLLVTLAPNIVRSEIYPCSSIRY
jgi:hypothetical protein